MLLGRPIQRLLHTTTTYYIRRKANPGIGSQTKVLHKEGLLNSEQDVEYLDDMESDFMEVHKTHKEHEKQLAIERENLRRNIVKRKYFTEKSPNFLTYSEKEQIKLLHSRDPEEWSAERLSESFPATVDIIRKIIRAQWTPKSAKRVRSHDEMVAKNWEHLRQGQFKNVGPELREHLMKFCFRNATDVENLTKDFDAQRVLPRPQRTDFLSIITSCKPYADKEPQQKMLTDVSSFGNHTPKGPTADDPETYLIDKVKDKQNMRMHELKATKLKEYEQWKPTDMLPNNVNAAESVQMFNTFSVAKYESNEVVVSQKDIKMFDINTTKDRIYIPKKLRAKGSLYKVDDCYYDVDGEFLYRVPGMTGSKM